MTWQDYVDKELVETGKIQKAAIIGQNSSVWAISAGFLLTPVERKAIVDAFSNPANTQANGIRLAGRKFFTLQCNEEIIYGKQGADGCVIVKIKDGVIVAEYHQPIQAVEAALAVQRVADWLKNPVPY